jgi:hypothetical protein
MNEIKSNVNEDPVYSKKVIELLTVANDYCKFTDKADTYPKNEILLYLQKVLPLIYLKASLLPEIIVDDEEATEHFVTEETWENIFAAFREKLGSDDEYYYVDLHEKSHRDAIKASLSENLADIYQDLCDFILLYQKPHKYAKENAIRDCRNLFEARTGFALVKAHMTVHYILFKETQDTGYPDE